MTTTYVELNGKQYQVSRLPDGQVYVCRVGSGVRIKSGSAAYKAVLAEAAQAAR